MVKVRAKVKVRKKKVVKVRVGRIGLRIPDSTNPKYMTMAISTLQMDGTFRMVFAAGAKVGHLANDVHYICLFIRKLGMTKYCFHT